MNLNRLDKLWYSADRRIKRYEDGVEDFLNYVKKNLGDLSSIQCPCIKCGNMKVHDITVVKDHLFCNGIDSSYDVWTWHGDNICNVEEDKCNTPKYTLVVFDMFRVFCKRNLNVS